MVIRNFVELPEIEDMGGARLKVGDQFLFGNKMVQQKEECTAGDMVTFYEVIVVNERNGNVEYKPVYVRLKEY
jgi:hypothetical protein